MRDTTHEVAVYLHLAQASARRRRPYARDRFFVLAAALATEHHLDGLAAYCRRMVLTHNPHHLIGRWATVDLALETDAFQGVVRQIRRRYPLERAERLLDSLGLDAASGRHTYATSIEFCAAILGVDPEVLAKPGNPPD